MRLVYSLKGIKNLPTEIADYYNVLYADVLRVMPENTELRKATGDSIYIPSNREEVDAIELNFEGDYRELRYGPGTADWIWEGKDFLALKMFGSISGGPTFWIPQSLAFMHPHIAETIRLTREALGE